MKVKITSPCMAMLLYEASKSNGQTEGLLCGEFASESLQQITDSNVTTVTEDVLSIYNLQDAPTSNNSFNSDSRKIPRHSSSILGRYKFCRRSGFSLTVREKSLHRKLVRSIEQSGGCGAHAVTILIQENWIETQSNYSWQFVAFSYQNGKFIATEVEIVNLKAISCGAYKPYPAIHQRQLSPQALSAYAKLQPSSSNNNSHAPRFTETTSEMSKSIVKSLDEAAASLRNTECLLEAAYSEKQRLKQQLIDMQAQKKAAIKLQEASLAEQSEPKRHSFSSSSSSSDTDSSSGEENLSDHHHHVITEHQEAMESRQFDDPVDLDNVERSLGNETAPPMDKVDTKVPVDPFVCLVDIAKADLKRSEQQCNSGSEATGQLAKVTDKVPEVKDEGQLMKEYNDERPWCEKTRAGRLKN